MGSSSSTPRRCGPTEPSTDHAIVEVEFDGPRPPHPHINFREFMSGGRRSSLKPAFDVVRPTPPPERDAVWGSSLSSASGSLRESPALPVISPPPLFGTSSDQYRFGPRPPPMRLPGSAWARPVGRGSRRQSMASTVSDGSTSLSLEQLTFRSVTPSQQHPSEGDSEEDPLMASIADGQDDNEAEAAERQDLEPLQDFTPVQPYDPQAAERSRRLRGNFWDSILGSFLSADHRYDLLRIDLEQHSVITPAGYLLDGNGALWECSGVLDGLPQSLGRFELIALSTSKRSSSNTFISRVPQVKVVLASNPLFAPKPTALGVLRGIYEPHNALEGGVAGRLLTFLDNEWQRIADIRSTLYARDYSGATRAAFALLGSVETFPMCHRLRAVATAIHAAVGFVALSRQPKQLLHHLALRGDEGMVPKAILQSLSKSPEAAGELLEQFCRHRFEYAVLIWRNTVQFLQHYMHKSASEDYGERVSPDDGPFTLAGKQPEQNE